MKKSFFNIALCLLGSVSMSNAAVTAGDVAIIGFYTDGNANGPNTGDAFAWIALNDIAAGEVLYFSDASYYNDTAAFRQEGLLRYTVQAGGISAGTVLTVESGNLGAGYTHLDGTAYSNQSALAPASSGDQLVIFQDNDVSNTAGFTGLWAVNNSSNTWNALGVTGVGTGGFPPDQNDSNLYPGLINGTNAVAVGQSAVKDDEWDNTRYVGTTTGTASELRASIANAANWQGTNNAAAVPTTWVTNGSSSFTVTPEPSSALLISVASLFGLTLRRRK